MGTVLSKASVVAVAICCIASASLLNAATATVSEQARATRWVLAKFAAQIPPASDRSYLLPDHAGMERNEHEARPLHIGSVDFSNGLFMGRSGAVTVHLLSPAKQFEATVGLDGRSSGCGYSNGHQQFSVQVDGKTVAQTPEVEAGRQGSLLRAELHGATDFRIVNQGPGGGWCNEAVWANARILMQDGSSVLLGDLPVGPDNDAANIAPPFSFTYNGRPSSDLLRTWTRKMSSHAIDEKRTEYDLTWTDPATGLVVEMIARTSQDFPVVEWTLYFENTSDSATPILENISAIDTDFAAIKGSQALLHHFHGSSDTPTDFEPYRTTLDRGAALHLATSGGRPTDESMCYFNLEESGQGVILGLGWPGQWSADFSRPSDDNVRIRAGQELTHFKLLPHEKVRTPLVALLFWNGNDWMRGQNLWRSWMLADNLPRFSDGKITPHMAASSAYWTDEMTRATEQNQKQFLDRYHALGIKPDFWWMDAGWYVNNGRWTNTGTWTVDPIRFPKGLRAVTDYAHAMGIQSIDWFELERVTRDSALWKDHPDWLLSDPEKESAGQRLLNLGNPDAERWVVSFLDKFLTGQGIDVYRIDFNIAPLSFWRANDAPDRQGITEIRYVTGFLDYLDQLHRLHPNLQIDTCASGGRRDDLETLRRAVPMHRSDFGGEPTGSQNIGYGIAFWVPYYGAPINPRDNYVFRSSWSPQINMSWDVRRTDLDIAWIRSALDQWRSIAPDLLGDYYPLLPYDPSENAWMAWQFHRPDQNSGVVQVFRRTASAADTMRLRFRGLDVGSRYTVTNLDTRTTKTYSGNELEKTGIDVVLPDPGSSAVLTYKFQDR